MQIDSCLGGCVGVVIISASCCIPGMAALDEQARRVVEQAAAETGVPVQVRTTPVTAAYFGGVPREVVAKLQADFTEHGHLGVPAVLINGKAISYGVPEPAQVKAALLSARDRAVNDGGKMK